MADNVKRMDLKDFVAQGFLQEANRQFFHKVGLALEVIVDDDGTTKMGGVWDYRDDPEGMLFSKGTMSEEKANTVKAVMAAKLSRRVETGECGIDGVQALPSGD